jgi:hypothetical protein
MGDVDPAFQINWNEIGSWRVFMKSKIFVSAAHGIALLVVMAVSITALAENPRHKVFSGMMNAYTPQTTTGPYEVRGPWSLTWSCEKGKADFYAALNMELSDGWVMTKNMMNFDPSMRNAHTHHITVVGGEVTPIANGFRVTGIAKFTLSGGPAPASIEPSQVVIEVTGGTEVEYSNMTLTFLSPGSNHFGSEPLTGVVHTVKEFR